MTKKILFGYQDAERKLKSANYLAIRPGDFVDVKLHADISTYRDGDKTETRVYFSVDRVVRLCASRDMPKVRSIRVGQVKN